jgi:hypothetical protein
MLRRFHPKQSCPLVLLLILWVATANAHGSFLTAAQMEKPPAPNGVQSLTIYESRIGEPGLLIENSNIQMWVPSRYEEHSQIIFTYLQSGYDVLSAIFGGHDMPVKFSIEHYPPGSPYFWGGTDARGTIRYGFSNLEDDYPEWNLYGVPHVSGYYEEMAHCFAYDLGIIGETSVGLYETLGMMIGGETALRAAWNPYTQTQSDQGYECFAASTAYYLDHDTCEPGVTENICLTRILAHIFKTNVVNTYGWEALTNTFSDIQNNYPLRAYSRDHTWGAFLEYLNNHVGLDLHPLFGSYGLPILQWTGESGYRTDGVEPSGEANRYRFRVKIIDREGNLPTDAKLHLYGMSGDSSGNAGQLAGCVNTQVPMLLVGGNASNGWIYQAEMEIIDPEMCYYAFSANDGVHPVFQAVGKPTVKRPILFEHGVYLPIILLLWH